MTGMENAIEQAVRVLMRHPLGRPAGGTASGAFVLCGCGTVINGTSRDHAHSQAREHVARALATAGLLSVDRAEGDGGEP